MLNYKGEYIYSLLLHLLAEIFCYNWIDNILFYIFALKNLLAFRIHAFTNYVNFVSQNFQNNKEIPFSGPWVLERAML